MIECLPAVHARHFVAKSTSREKNLEKAQKEAKVKARKEAARQAELADNITDDDLAALEDNFFRETGLSGAPGLKLLASRRIAAAETANEKHSAGEAAHLGDGVGSNS